jgi:hypothetical protein
VSDANGDRPLAGEAVAETVAVGLAAIANPVLGLILGGAVAYRNNRVVQGWVDQANATLERLGRSLDPADDLAIAIFNRLTIGAIQTSRHDKWIYLAEALANSGSSTGTPDFIQELSAEPVVRYTPEHVEMLYMSAQPAEWIAERGLPVGRADTLGEILPATILTFVDDVDLVAESIWRDLHRDGLIMNEPGPAMQINAFAWGVTAMGRRFLRHLGKSA